MARREERLRNVFFAFNGGEPLGVKEIVPVAKVVRGPDWNTANAEKFLGKMAPDGPGACQEADFVSFFMSKLEQCDDAKFSTAVDALREAAGASAEQRSLGEKFADLVLWNDAAYEALLAPENRTQAQIGAFALLCLTGWFGIAWLVATLLLAGGTAVYAMNQDFLSLGKEVVAGAAVAVLLFLGCVLGVSGTLLSAGVAAAAWRLLDTAAVPPPGPSDRTEETAKTRGKRRQGKGKGKAKKGENKKPQETTEDSTQAESEAPSKAVSEASPEEAEPQQDEDQEVDNEDNEDEDEEEDEEEYDFTLMLGKASKAKQKVKTAPRKYLTGKEKERVRDDRFDNQYVDGGYGDQDWGNVVWGSRSASARAPTARVEKNNRAINEAMRSGNFEAVAKTKHNGPANFHTLDEADQAFALGGVSLDLRKRIQQARTAKGLKQAQLAKMINERPAVVNEYEAGTAIPSNAVLGKLEKALGVKLRGKLN